MGAKDLLLQDSLKAAIESERKAVILRNCVLILSAICSVSIITTIVLLII